MTSALDPETRDDGHLPLYEFREPAAWSTQDWTPALAKSAWCDADDNGLLMAAADLCKRVMQDDRVKTGLRKRTNLLLRCDLSFEASGDRRKSKRVVKTLEADDDFEAIASEDALAQLLAWGLMLGVGLAEKVWTRSKEHGDRDLPVLKIWNPRWLRYDKSRRQWLVYVEEHGEIPILKDDPKWFLFFPYGEHEPWAQGLWWPLAFWWLVKSFSSNDWSSFDRAAGAAIPVGEAPEQSKPEARDTWRKQLEENLRRGRAVVLPPGYKLSYLLATVGAHESFKEHIELSNRSIDITLLGGNLGTEVESGSLAAAEVHERSEQAQAEADGGVLSAQLRQKVLTWWALFNFGDRQLAPWPFWDTEPPEDQKKKGEGFGALGTGLEKLNAALAPLGLELDPDDVTAMLAKAGLKTRTKAPAPLAPAAPVAPPDQPPASDPNAPPAVPAAPPAAPPA